jgi:outer membrane protein assembly factor BamB
MTTGKHRLLSFLVATGLVVVAAGCNFDWTQFGYQGGSLRTSGDTSLTQAELPRLAPQFAGQAGGAVTSSAAEANGVSYVTSDAGTLVAFDAKGTTGVCSGTPNTCQPLWSATIQAAGTNHATLSSSPAVSSGTVMVGSSDGRLLAFDAAGSTNCSGTPKVCTPLWTANVGTAIVGSPTVSGTVVYVGTTDGALRAFDIAGTTGCSGTPKICAPLWTADTGSSIVDTPTVSAGRVYVGSANGDVSGYDAAGSAGCSGTPTTCAALWTGATGSSITTSSPAVDHGMLFVGATDGRLSAFDTTSAAGCSGTPTRCAPAWTVATGGAITSSPAVAGGRVFIGSTDHKLYAVGEAGVSGCSGTPKVCAPLWTATTGGAINSSPAVTGPTVFVGSADHSLYAFDAAGAAGCSGTPIACNPLWSAATGGAVDSSPTLALGGVQVGSRDGLLHVYAPWSFTRPTCPTNPNAGLSPCQVQDAYRLPSQVTGTGRTIAIVDAFDNPNAEADLAVYRSTYGLPPCTTANGCFTKLNQRGAAGSYPKADQGWSEEIALDLDAASAVCPLCHLTLVESDSDSFSNLAAAEDAAAATAPTVISNSFGGTEFPTEVGANIYFLHPGITTTVATGDAGYGTSWPAVVPGVTAVGGTQLTTDSSARGWSETVWNGAQSGCSAYELKPVWQTDTGCSHRTIADVSALAGWPGLAVYTTYGTSTGWEQIGGTSLATPIVAGVYALAYPDAPMATTYASTSSLFDITSGNNGSCGGSYLCTAGPGYDGPTGLGTPCGTAAFGTGPFATPDCATALASGGGASPAAISPSIPMAVGVPSCDTPAPGSATCFAVRFDASS